MNQGEYCSKADRKAHLRSATYLEQILAYHGLQEEPRQLGLPWLTRVVIGAPFACPSTSPKVSERILRSS